MKVTVVTGPDGSILGTARLPEGDYYQDQPVSRLVAGPGQKAYEIELPRHLEGLESVEEFHNALKDYLPPNRPTQS